MASDPALTSVFARATGGLGPALDQPRAGQCKAASRSSSRGAILEVLRASETFEDSCSLCVTILVTRLSARLPSNSGEMQPAASKSRLKSRA